MTGQEVNISGATLFEPFFQNNASGNDFIDLDNDGQITDFNAGTFDRLWTTQGGNKGFDLQYRAIGSGNGFQELIDYGSVNGPQPGAGGQSGYEIIDGINGGSPNVRNAASVGIGSFTGPTQIDISTTDVPTTFFVTDTRPGAFWGNSPLTNGAPTAGYGNNQSLSNPVANPTGTPLQAGGQPNVLQGLSPEEGPGSTQLTLDTSVTDGTAIFQTPLALAPIAFIANAGAGIDGDQSGATPDGNIKKTELQHLFVTGRMQSGENLIAITRDSGSGTRNGAMNSIGVDPSFGVGDNVGLRNRGSSTASNDDSLDTPGGDYIPTNKQSSSRLENTVENTRLGVSYNGIVGNAGPDSAGNRYEILNVANDTAAGWDGSSYVRPIMTQNGTTAADNNVIFNLDPNTGHQIGAVQTLSTIGNPLSGTIVVAADGTPRFDDASNAQPGEKVFDPVADFPNRPTAGQGTPMEDPTAALFIRNYLASIDAFTQQVAGGQSTINLVGTPGQALASSFALVDAAEGIIDPNQSENLIANPSVNPALQSAGVLPQETIEAGYGGPLAGSVPFRDASTGPYTDGQSANYVTNDGTTVAYGDDIATGSRNAIVGDFQFDGVRDANDIDDMVVAFEASQAGQRSSLGDPDAVLELLGDFDADGNFDLDDVRYGADGLFNRGRAGNLLDRKQNFIDIDNASTAPDSNLFGTTLATGKAYAAGDSRGDVAGSGLISAGWAPQGADGAVDAQDIDYVYDQFQTNPFVSDGSADWANLDEAVGFDLSADMTGDLSVNQADVNELVQVVLGTNYGDANLDGSVNFTDFTFLQANFGQTGGWADADFSGDDAVNFTDFTFIQANFGLTAPVSGTLATSEVSSLVATSGISAVVDDGELELQVDVTTGEMTLIGANTFSSGFQIISQAGSLIPDGDGDASPFDLYLANSTSLASAGSFAGTLIDGETMLGLGFEIGGTEDLVFTYGIAGIVGDLNGTVTYIPEPASLGLIGVVGVLLTGRRRKA
ncbi:MAG: PEP-CTERM sorting domain-containing protein [Planctomycetota bacterium]